MKDLEFLPAYRLRARQNRRLWIVRLWLLTVLALAMVCWGFYSHQAVAQAQAELAAVQSQLAAAEGAKHKAQLADLTEREKTYKAHADLVARLAGEWPRAGLVREIARSLPEQLVLSRLEIERQQREVAGSAAGGKEAVDRVRLEGYASEDLALSRFLQTMNESSVFQRGELACSKDATFREREVRVFAATFYVPGNVGQTVVKTARVEPREALP